MKIIFDFASFLVNLKSTEIRFFSCGQASKCFYFEFCSATFVEDKSAFGNSMGGLLQTHHQLLYNCKASAKTFQNFFNSFKMQVWDNENSNFFIIVKHSLRPFKTSSPLFLRCKYGIMMNNTDGIWSKWTP